MSNWNTNKPALKRRFPEVARRVEAAKAAAGVPWPSPEDSSQIARHWLEDRTWEEGVFLVVSGFGDARHVTALLDCLPRNVWVFAVESDPARLRAAIEQFDLRGILEDPRFLLAVGEIDEPFFQSLGQLDVLRIKDVQTLIFAPSYNAASSYFSRAFTEVARQIDFRRKLFGTAVVDAALWQSNTFANLESVAIAPDVEVLRDACKGLPMIVVSAGPSLDGSIEFLKQASRVAVVVAVNSSYRAVRRAGVIPHFVMAADPRQYVTKGFEGVPIDGTWLVTTPIVHPAVAARFGRAIFSWSGSNQLVTEIRRRCGLQPGTTLIEQGTVSACAVDLAIVLGCDRVCLVGQDMAVREDGRSHVSDSFYTDLKRNSVDVGKCRRLPGNTVESVPVEEKLYVYLKTFEQLVAARAGLSFLNTAMYGARIAGVPYAAFDEASQWLGSDSGGGLGALNETLRARSAGSSLTIDGIRAVLKPTLAYARAILREALTLAAKIEALPERLSGEGFRNAPEVKDVFECLAGLEKKLKSQPREFGILEAGRTRMELYRCREFEVGEEVRYDHWRRILHAREFAWALAEGAWFLNSCVSRVVTSGTASQVGDAGKQRDEKSGKTAGAKGIEHT